VRLNKRVSLCVPLGMLLAAGAVPARAQSLVMSLPRASQRAVVGQRIGLTDVTITYHRPLVGGRKVFGGIVPYGQVWRAGANDNTTIEFSDPVSIEGQVLAKGTYGLHVIPAADSWTIIFSKNYTSWGSFSYDQKEDALRVTVKPAASEFHEALAYDFDDVKPDSALVTLRWEKVAVPFKVSVDLKEVTMQEIRNQLRTLPQYTWMGWDDAAKYSLANKIGLEEGLRWADRSIQVEERFENLMTKASLLEALNKTSEATTARNRAMEVGNASQVYFWGRQLQTQNKKTEAIEIYRMVAKRFPQHWVGHVARARAYAADGDFANAVKEMRAAEAAGAPEQQKPNLETLIKRLENKEDING
jgi:tetratricopeptide (TPR) repeat protein